MFQAKKVQQRLAIPGENLQEPAKAVPEQMHLQDVAIAKESPSMASAEQVHWLLRVPSVNI